METAEEAATAALSLRDGKVAEKERLWMRFDRDGMDGGDLVDWRKIGVCWREAIGVGFLGG